MRVSEIRVKRIRVNQGLGVYNSNSEKLLGFRNLQEKFKKNTLYCNSIA